MAGGRKLTVRALEQGSEESVIVRHDPLWGYTSSLLGYLAKENLYHIWVTRRLGDQFILIAQVQ